MSRAYPARSGSWRAVSPVVVGQTQMPVQAAQCHLRDVGRRIVITDTDIIVVGVEAAAAVEW